MRYLILESVRGYKVVDITKNGLDRQELYVLDADSHIEGKVINEFNDPLEAISQLLLLQTQKIKKDIMEEVKKYDYRY